ncbi:MAG TPA: 23S rRNA (guanosine(2251)-2'-O)-methyltransferase RlmB, partial [Gammaproteobacteria bacterium]|nr:23S rRNA (guanosine(2251)-2'-O)-methyltransferase RlmB [Gammaproteobacteria bacterium]
MLELARAAGVRYQAVDDAWFKRRTPNLNHQGVLLECHSRAVADEQALKDQWPALGETPLLLVLDGITDPRNLGACLRTANAVGVDAVILPKRNSAP